MNDSYMCVNCICVCMSVSVCVCVCVRVCACVCDESLSMNHHFVSILQEFEGVKMVFAVNSSLKMGTGKIAAQVGHACLGLHRILMREQEQYGELLLQWEACG